MLLTLRRGSMITKSLVLQHHGTAKEHVLRWQSSKLRWGTTTNAILNTKIVRSQSGTTVVENSNLLFEFIKALDVVHSILDQTSFIFLCRFIDKWSYLWVFDQDLFSYRRFLECGLGQRIVIMQVCVQSAFLWAIDAAGRLLKLGMKFRRCLFHI